MKTVTSSNATLAVDDAGWVIPKDSIYYNSALKRIVRVDFREYCDYYHVETPPDDLDILDLGYWSEPGWVYVPPAYDWRKNTGPLRAWREKTKVVKAEAQT